MSNDVELAAELLDGALDSFFSERYGSQSLALIARRSLVESERNLAKAFLESREARKIPDRSVVGEERCAICHKLMGDESSVDEEETVCKKCGPPDDEPSVTRDAVLIAGCEDKYGEEWDDEKMLEIISSWTPEQRKAVANYCWAVHLRASDNDVEIPSRPEILDSLAPARKPA